MHTLRLANCRIFLYKTMKRNMKMEGNSMTGGTISPAEYQGAAHAFATYGDNAMYPALGLAEEAGEVCGKIAKFIRKHEGEEPLSEPDRRGFGLETTKDEEEFREALKKELGDVCWMVAELCSVYGLNLGDVMSANIDKLTDRKNRGVIVGEGDDR